MSGIGACLCGTCPTCADGLATAAPVGDAVRFAHSAIRGRLLERIGTAEAKGVRSLARLATGHSDDPAVALVDAYAGGLHILGWNARRLAEDATLARSEDVEALTELTALLGYRPRPALAASTTVAFTLDDLETSPRRAIIAKGTQVASIPGQDETPQTFETDAEIEARADWNLLKPILPDQHQIISAATKTIVLAGATTAAKVGDIVFVFCTTQPPPGQKAAVEEAPNPVLGALVEQPLALAVGAGDAVAVADGQLPELPDVFEGGLYQLGDLRSWLVARVAEVRRPVSDPPRIEIDLADQVVLETGATLVEGGATGTVIVAGQKAAAFGSVAPDPALLPDEVVPGGSWQDFVMTKSGTGAGGALDLDAIYADAVPGRAVLFRAGSLRQLGRIAGARERSRAAFALSTKCSRIKVEAINLLEQSSSSFANKVRETAIYLETARERLLVTKQDISVPSEQTPARVLVEEVAPPPAGRRVVLRGRDFSTGKPAAEAAIVGSAADVVGGTELVFERPLATRFRGIGLEILGNAVSASHGATPASGPETLGSGDATTQTPRFALRGKPLAYVPAANARGYAPAIELRVAGRRYEEVPTLFGRGPGERVFTVRSARDGSAEVQFAGTLPRGSFNVEAAYRLGGGMAGNLGPGRLTMMMTPVLGVGSVSQPVQAEGGSDAESIEALREAAPQSIRTLDRVVALGDYEAFARSFRGVGKAMATEVFDGMRRLVCLTIATTRLEPAAAGSALVADLEAALSSAAPPGRSLMIAGFVEMVPAIGIALALDPAFRRGDVEAAVRARLATDFSRAARRFGQALHRSAVLAAVQAVPGVVAARITSFSVPGGPPEQNGRLFAPEPAFKDKLFVQAGLLAVDPGAITFTEMKP